MYPSLTQEPTGYYLDSYGLPVLVGETKISIEGWGNEDYSSVSDDSFQQVALDAALLDSRKYNLKDHPNYHLVEAEGGKPFDYDRRAEQSFADFISNVKDVKTVNLCAENTVNS